MALLQTGEPGSIEKFGMIGLLGIAVVVLWRAYVKKDEQVTALTRELAEAAKLLESLGHSGDSCSPGTTRKRSTR
jgi:hypothetical protein